MADSKTSRTLREITRIIFARLWAIVLIVAVVVGAVWLASTLSPKWYRSEVQLLAKPARGVDPLEKSATARDAVTLFVTTQRQIILSDYVLASALMQLEGERPSGEAVSAGRASSQQRWYTDQQVQDFIDANNRYINRVRKWVKVLTPGGPDATFTQTFVIQVDWPEQPERAAELAVDTRQLAAQRANQFTGHLYNAYLYRSQKLREMEFERSREYLSDRGLAEAKAQADAAAEDINRFLKANDLENNVLLLENMISGVGETGSASMVTRMQTEANLVRDRLVAAQALRAEILKQIESDPAAEVVVPDQVLADNPPLGDVVHGIITLRLQENALQARFTDTYQELRDIRAELQANIALLRSELIKQVIKLDQTIAPLQARLVQLNEIISGDGQIMERLGPMVGRYRALRDRLDSSKRVYDLKLEEVVMARSGYEQPMLITAIDAPTRPMAQDWRRPIIWLNVLAAFVAGVVLALVYAFLADHFDHTLKSIDEAERYLGVPVLANVPNLGRKIIHKAR